MPAHFLKDSELESELEWKEAAPDAEVLPFESVILSTQQEPDPWFESPVGEVASADRTTTLAKAPAGTGRGHVCGTEEEFREGGTYEPEEPPVLYGALGLPLCCDPPKRVRGGAGAGGRVHPVVAAPVVPGLACLTAAEIEFDQWYGATHPGTMGVEHWFIIPGPHPIDDYHIEGVGALPAFGMQMFLASLLCAGFGPFAIVPAGGGCADLSIVVAGPHIYVVVQAVVDGPAFDYSFRAATGAC